jgi:diaminopimelate decarboxylase
MIVTEPAAPPLLAYRHGQLEMEGVPLRDLLARHATPFFLLSERRLVDNYRALARGLAGTDGDVTLRYCAKANNEAGVLGALAAAGSALLASHAGEVELALACGFPPARVAFQRPVVSAAEAAAVLDAGVGMVHVFRPADVETFAAAAAGSGRTVRVSLRLRGERRGLGSPLAALNARLGLSAAEALAVARSCRQSGWLRVAALNLYVGTQQVGFAAFDRALREACEVARGLRRQGCEVEEINLGGGIPAPGLRRLALRRLWARWRDRPAAWHDGEVDGGEAPARVESFARGIAERYRAIAAAAGLLPPPALAAEPGRAIVGNAAVLVSRVAAVDGRWVFVDASRNHLGESPLLFRRRIVPLRAPPTEGRGFVHLAGSTLNTTDVLDLRRRLPSLAVGDALAFCDAGAYSISRASRYGGLSPAVLMLGLDGAVRAIRRAENSGDLRGPMAAATTAAVPVEVG